MRWQSLDEEQKRPRIVLVEDDLVQREMIAQMLIFAGYDVTSAATGEEGQELIESVKPDAAVVDLHLPAERGVTGLVLLKSIKENPETAELPVLIITADTTEETYVLVLSSGASDILLKPLRITELTIRIQNVLELRKNRADLREANAKLEREKKRLLRYFSEDFVTAMLNDEISAELGGISVDATILFMDIRNSTGIAEQIGPQKFAEFVSMIFTDVMDLIFANRGSVNKLLGDGILATFGCPVPSEKDAENAVKTASQIREYFQVINEARAHEDIGGDIGFGIGVASGKVFAGNIGSFRRMEYAVMGDPVNLAARLQELSKTLSVDIVIDGTTKSKIPASYAVRDSGVKNVRGRHGEVEAWILS